METNSTDGSLELPLGDTKKEKPLAPGYILTSNASVLGTSVDDLVLQLLYHPTTMLVDHKGVQDKVVFLPGNTLDGRAGPDVTKAPEVVIIGKMPNAHETMGEKLMCDRTGELVKHTLKEAGATDCSNWYVTNVLRFMPPDGGKKLSAQWLKDCRYLLEQELKLIQPKYILLLGTDAVKALFGKQANLSRLRGSTDLTYNGAKVVITNHPALVLADPSTEPAFARDIQTFVQLTQGVDIALKSPRHYESITDTNRLIDVVTGIMDEWSANPTQPRRIAMDCEWGGTDGSDVCRSQFRSIQFSHVDHEGYTIILRREGLIYDPATCCEETAVIEILKLLLAYPNVQVGGHNFRSDLLRLKRVGLDCMEQFLRGIDTMLAYHLISPAEEGFGLEKLSVRFTDLGRYDIDVEKWLIANKYKSAKNSKSTELVGKMKLRKFGYAHVPDALMFPVYAPADVDVVMRCWPILEEQLKKEKIAKPYVDSCGRTISTLYDLYYHNIQLANVPLEEVESVGINTDTERLKQLTELFAGQRDVMLKAFREEIKWPDFNQRSPDHNRRFLFGGAFGKKVVCPAGAITLTLQPVKTTEKPSRDWTRVRDEEILSGKALASTDGETLMILKHQDERAGRLQKIKFVDQIIKNFLRAPNQVEEDDEVEWDEGLIGLVSPDSRIRTTISQLTDTGRYRSYEPNMQNLPKKQETELRLIFSPDPAKLQATKKWQSLPEEELKAMGLLHPGYYPIRSCFMASAGHVLIEADYKQAELNVLAHISGDPDMIALLADDKRDMHSEMAITAFNLKCTPDEVKQQYNKQRVMAKNVNFGS